MKHKMRITLASLILVTGMQPAFADDSPKNFKEVMQRISNNMQKLVGHLMKDEFTEVANLAELIANHDEPPVSQRLRIIAALGLDFTDFKKNDDNVHIHAVALKAAAEKKDVPAIIESYGKVMQSCNDCHRDYRKRIQDLDLK